MEQKRKLTPEELSAVRSIAARKGVEARKAAGYTNVGRPKGWKKDPALCKNTPHPKSLPIKQEDYDVFRRIAGAKSVSLTECVHLVAVGLRQRNPSLFQDAEPII